MPVRISSHSLRADRETPSNIFKGYTINLKDIFFSRFLSVSSFSIHQQQISDILNQLTKRDSPWGVGRGRNETSLASLRRQPSQETSLAEAQLV